MNKWLLILLLTSIILFTSLIVINAKTSDHPLVYVDGREIIFDNNVVVEDNVVYVPSKELFEALGFVELYWDAETKTAAAFKGKTGIALQVGNKAANKNNLPIFLKSSPKIIKDQLMIPLDTIVTDLLDCKCEWISDTNVILILTKENFENETVNEKISKNLVGHWASNIFSYGNLVGQYDATVGTSYSGEMYIFREDGTYRSVVAGSGSIFSGIAIQEGRYKVKGNYIIFYDNKETWNPNPTRDDQTPAFKNKPVYDILREYKLKEDANKLTIDNVSHFHRIKD